MLIAQKLKRYKKALIIVAAVLATLIVTLVLFVNRFVEPILRDRLNTLIVQGSDSLYTYTLGELNANFFGGSVEVENLHIKVDSNRYHELKRRNALPSLTMQLDLERGRIRGLRIFPLLFGKKIKVKEIVSRDADIRIARHIHKRDTQQTTVPLWKAMQPNITGIEIERVRLDGVKFLYRNADTSESVKLQFDRCDALFEDIVVDSAATYDTTRIGFTGNIWMRFHDLKFRSPDSSMKLKAEWITYSSKQRSFEVDSFKMQPTLEEKEDFYRAAGTQKPMQVIEFAKARLVNVHIDRFFHNNIIQADSLVFVKPEISIYLDRTPAPTYESKIGQFPHQRLLRASSTIKIKNISVQDGRLEYSEYNPKTEGTGELLFTRMNLSANNVTNDSVLIRQDPITTAKVDALLFGSSPLSTEFRFYLDSANGRFDAKGTLTGVNATQVNKLAVPMANVHMQSFDMHRLDFQVTGEDYGARANVQMRYNNLALVLRKTDEETGVTKTKKFLTKILNKYVIWPDNPGSDGVLRTATNVNQIRLTTKSFFGLLWKSIFSGMQDIMMKSGRYE
jgi:hypothetical protein